MISSLLIIAVLFGVAYVLVTRYPTRTRRWYQRFSTSRRLIFGLFTLVFAWFLLASGVLYLVIAGAAIFFAVALWVLLEDPQQEVRQWIQ